MKAILAKKQHLEYIVFDWRGRIQTMATAHLIGSTEPLEIRKIFCIGRNYADHAREMNAAIPEAPIFFLKPSTAIIGEGEAIRIPSISKDLHHEIEMTVLIGRGGKDILRGNALNHVAGYGIGLDMTLRDIQSDAKKKGLPWTLAKGFDTSAPISHFVPADEISDPHTLEVMLDVNGAIRQHSSTSNFIFKIDELIAYISKFFTFERGDIIFTGTPEGVAAAASGDRLEARLLSPTQTVLASLRVSVQ
jgi:acylpyruvate hydrolase